MKYEYNEDLFKSSTMTFGEHLEELRSCLIKALAWIVAGFIIGLFVGRHVVAFIQTPLEAALVNYYRGLYSSRLDEALAQRQGGGLVGLPSVDQMRPLVEDERLLFDEVLVQPEQLLAQLRQAYPGVLGQVELPANPAGHALRSEGPTELIPADLRDGAGLCQAIVAAGRSAAPSPARRIWELLSARQQMRLAALAAADPWDDAAQQALLDALNWVLLSDVLYEADAFADVRLDGEASGLLAALGTLPPGRLARLNRVLLEAAFPSHVARTYPQLVPLLLWRSIAEDRATSIKSLNVQESFLIYIKASLLAGVLLTSPMVFFHLWSFVAAGLFPHEKKYVYVFLPFSLALFFAGAALAFFFVFQPVLDFLFRFNRLLGIDPDPRISEWLSFVLLLPLGFGVSFQLPLVMLFLERIGVFTVESYLSKWRMSVLIIFFLSMMLTPADPMSMLLMAVPLTLLYFGGIALCHFMPRAQNPFVEATG